jgi:hypothetical protein
MWFHGYLSLFPNARYYIMGMGGNDLGDVASHGSNES